MNREELLDALRARTRARLMSSEELLDAGFERGHEPRLILERRERDAQAAVVEAAIALVRTEREWVTSNYEVASGKVADAAAQTLIGAVDALLDAGHERGHEPRVAVTPDKRAKRIERLSRTLVKRVFAMHESEDGEAEYGPMIEAAAQLRALLDETS